MRTIVSSGVKKARGEGPVSPGLTGREGRMRFNPDAQLDASQVEDRRTTQMMLGHLLSVRRPPQPTALLSPTQTALAAAIQRAYAPPPVPLKP